MVNGIYVTKGGNIARGGNAAKGSNVAKGGNITKSCNVAKGCMSHVYMILCRFLYQRAVTSQKMEHRKRWNITKDGTSQKMVISQKVVIWPRTNQQEQCDETKMKRR